MYTGFCIRIEPTPQSSGKICALEAQLWKGGGISEGLCLWQLLCAPCPGRSMLASQ